MNRSIRSFLVASVAIAAVLAFAAPAAAHIEQLDITGAFLGQDGKVAVRIDLDCTQTEIATVRVRIDQKTAVGEDVNNVGCPSSPQNGLAGQVSPTRGTFHTGPAVICVIVTTEVQGVRHDREKVCETITIQ